jgi:hypothetical protein
MKKQLITSVLFPVCAIGHHLLFWEEKMGLNTLLFSLLMTAALFYLSPESRKSGPALITATAVILTAGLVVWNNSLFSKVNHIIFSICLVGFVQGQELRFIFFAFCLGIISMFEMRIKALRELFPRSWQAKPGCGLPANAKMMVTVAPVFLVFFSLYFFANNKFAELTLHFFLNIIRFVEEEISLPRMLSLAVSILITGSILWKTSVTYFQRLQLNQTFMLVRERSVPVKNLAITDISGLRKEYRTVFFLIIILNKLLLTMNILDIRYVWFGDIPDNPSTLKAYVHEGTYLLIASILFAMGVVLFVFRKNLNFYPENKWLRWLTFGWIVQNGVLALSVGIRNWQYIDACGLAYKRIGVFIFLLLTLFGLWTMFRKVQEKRSFYFLAYQNGWALFVVLLLACFVNWDVFITRYNLSASLNLPLDTGFLLHEVSDKNLFVLEENQGRIARLLNQETPANTFFESALFEKKRSFCECQSKQSWLSWNLADERNRYLCKTLLPAQLDAKGALTY